MVADGIFVQMVGVCSNAIIQLKSREHFILLRMAVSPDLMSIAT